MNRYQIPVHELTSKAAIFGIAAELIQTNMESEADLQSRVGTCAAFNWIIDAVSQDHTLSYVERDKVVKLAHSAKMDFRELYYTDGSRSTKDTVYWMGTRSDMGQKRRMAALLAAAKVVR